LPHKLRLPAVAGVILALVLGLVLSSRGTAASPELDSEEQAFVTLINNYRQQNGLRPLAIDWEMENSSDWMSGDMGQKAYFSHTDSLGRDPWTRMCSFGYCYNTWKGENIAAGFTTAASVFTAWQNSPGHNANMLGPNYTAMGISRVYTAGSPYTWYWTNDFGGVQSGAAAPAGSTTTPTPSPSPTVVPATPSPVPVCDLGLPLSLALADSDCDGFPDTLTVAGRAPESKIGTNPTRDCGSTSMPDDESGPDAWPVDFNDDRLVNGQDLGKFQPAYNKLVSQGPFGPDSIPGTRFDLNGDGIINERDTGKLQAYFNKACS
jgi:uncharacterized protein YkwD